VGSGSIKGVTKIPGLDGPDLPAHNFSHLSAYNFLHQLESKFEKDGVATVRLRMPTEEEWEYACRAGTTSEYFFGDDPNRWRACRKFGWHTNPEFTFTTGGRLDVPVGMKRPNPWGLYDLYGTGAQFCANTFYLYPDSKDGAPHFYRASQIITCRGVGGPPIACRSAMRAIGSHEWALPGAGASPRAGATLRPIIRTTDDVVVAQALADDLPLWVPFKQGGVMWKEFSPHSNITESDIYNYNNTVNEGDRTETPPAQ
jgi:hypothetical protein